MSGTVMTLSRRDQRRKTGDARSGRFLGSGPDQRHPVRALCSSQRQAGRLHLLEKQPHPSVERTLFGMDQIDPPCRYGDVRQNAHELLAGQRVPRDEVGQTADAQPAQGGVQEKQTAVGIEIGPAFERGRLAFARQERPDRSSGAAVVKKRMVAQIIKALGCRPLVEIGRARIERMVHLADAAGGWLASPRFR